MLKVLLLINRLLQLKIDWMYNQSKYRSGTTPVSNCNPFGPMLLHQPFGSYEVPLLLQQYSYDNQQYCSARLLC